MDDELRRALSRREMLRRSGGLMALAGLAPLIAACGGSDSTITSVATPAATSAAGSTAAGSTAAAPAGDIKMWWWGEQEAVGIQKWMDDVMSRRSPPSEAASVDATLMDTDQVIPQFTQAPRPPATCRTCSSCSTASTTWRTSGWATCRRSTRCSPRARSARRRHEALDYQGKPYRTGFYAIGFGIAYNKCLFEKAGLDPNAPPTTWDAFMAANAKLKESGVIPISAAASRTASSASGTSSTR